MVNFNNKYKTMKHIKEYHEFINENLAHKLEDVLYKKFIDNKQHKQWFDDYDELEDPIFYTMGVGGRMAFDSVVAKDQAKFVKAVTAEVEKFNSANKTKFKVQPDQISESVNEGTDIKKGDTVEKKFASDEKDYTRKFKVLSIDNSGKAELEEIGNKKTTKMYVSDLSKLNEATEQDYIVTYYTIKNDDDIDWDLEVKAKSPEDAIAKAKSSNDLPRNARAFSAQLKKK
jgi:hypothetical protein